MLDLVWDMETQDPDDFLTLLFLLGRQDVRLKAITITPGSPDQVGLVRRALHWLDRDVPVGAWDIRHPKSCVSSWHYGAYGPAAPSVDAEPGGELLLRVCDEQTTLLTGAPLKNLGAAMRLDEEGRGRLRIGRWVAQGGFAGEGVVPPEKQLPAFRGLATCPTFNLNGDPRSALKALMFAGIGVRRFVSRNVCHGARYDAEVHARMAAVKDRSKALSLIWKGMDAYLKKDPAGKKLHDPLAACCALDEGIGTWAEVELYREGGAWGARPVPGSGTWIITDYDRERFLEVFLAPHGTRSHLG